MMLPGRQMQAHLWPFQGTMSGVPFCEPFWWAWLQTSLSAPTPWKEGLSEGVRVTHPPSGAAIQASQGAEAYDLLRTHQRYLSLWVILMLCPNSLGSLSLFYVPTSASPPAAANCFNATALLPAAYPGVGFRTAGLCWEADQGLMETLLPRC